MTFSLPSPLSLLQLPNDKLCKSHDVMQRKLKKDCDPGGGYSLIWAIKVCAAPKGRGFQPFWS